MRLIDWVRMPSHVRAERSERFHVAVSKLCTDSERRYQANGRKPVEETEEYHRLNGAVNDLWETVPFHVRAIEYHFKIDTDYHEDEA
jgi:hypothetical protein